MFREHLTLVRHVQIFRVFFFLSRCSFKSGPTRQPRKVKHSQRPECENIESLLRRNTTNSLENNASNFLDWHIHCTLHSFNYVGGGGEKDQPQMRNIKTMLPSNHCNTDTFLLAVFSSGGPEMVSKKLKTPVGVQFRKVVVRIAQPRRMY